MARKPKKVVLKDREFNSVADFLKACNASSSTYCIAKKKGITDQEFYDARKKVEKEKKEETETLKESNKTDICTNISTGHENIHTYVNPNTYPKNNIEEIEDCNSSNKVLLDANTIVSGIEAIEDIKMINLIDFENISNDEEILSQYLKDPRCVNIFFYNATLYSNNYYMRTRYSKSQNFQVITFEKEDQLVDHLISLYLGILISVMPTKHFNIISKDSGYLGFIHYLNMDNVTSIGTSYISTSKKKFNYSVCNYFANNRNIREGILFTQNELCKQIDEFYHNKGKKATYKNYTDVIKLLKDNKILKEQKYNGKITYSINKTEAQLVALDIQNGIR